MADAIVGNDQELALTNQRPDNDLASSCFFVVQVWILNIALDLALVIGNADDGPCGSFCQNFQGNLGVALFIGCEYLVGDKGPTQGHR